MWHSLGVEGLSWLFRALIWMWISSDAPDLSCVSCAFSPAASGMVFSVPLLCLCPLGEHSWLFTLSHPTLLRLPNVPDGSLTLICRGVRFVCPASLWLTAGPLPVLPHQPDPEGSPTVAPGARQRHRRRGPLWQGGRGALLLLVSLLPHSSVENFPKSLIKSPCLKYPLSIDQILTITDIYIFLGS